MLRNLGPGTAPWMYPLQALVNRKTCEDSSSLHQSFARVIASGGLGTADRLADAGLIEGRQCRACGQPASLHHRFECPVITECRDHYDTPTLFAAASATNARVKPL